MQSAEQVRKVTQFIRSVVKKQGFAKLIVPVSGGIDSSTVLLLSVQALGKRNVISVKLPYGKQNMKLADLIIKKAKIPLENIVMINIKNAVEEVIKSRGSIKDRIRKGNIMARIRMIMIYDLAKKRSALVCGAENKSEHMLGYYTRFGDQASDIEPIMHLYKTQVYQLAQYLEVPKKIIKTPPSAGLWPRQTDEKEMGFTYQEADQLLYLFLEKKLGVKEIKKRGYKNAEKIIGYLKKNKFKKETPYCLR